MKHVVILKSRAGAYGGLEKYTSRIASAFSSRGARVSILTTGNPKDSPDPSISFYPYKPFPWPSFIRMELFDKYVQNWLKENPADLVFGMDRNRFQTHFRAGNGVHAAYLKSRILTEGHLKHFTCLLNPMHRKILELEKAGFENKSLQKLFTNSSLVKAQVLQYYRVDPAKIQVIHNGVEWREMEADFNAWPSARERGFKKFNLDPNRFHFLFIGNGYLRKGLDRLLDALSKLNRKDFHLSVIGKDNQMELYQAKAVQMGLKDQASFFGSQAEIRLFYQMADVLAIPSFYDPFANVTVEALAMGLSVVSSKENGGSEILTSQNGLVIPDLLDPSSLVETLKAAMERPKTKERAISVRESVKYLDFSEQMHTLIDACG